jgi:putative ABC transport system permease protein
MLELHHIHKDYEIDGKPFPALKDISLAFPDKGFIAILGPSGCGKTTLLNIIGGLDHYTSGDLLIDGKSTKDFKDSEWDGYRNERVGFVFQSYNLISHMNVLANVEVSLMLNGVSRAERAKRAMDALKVVGLEGEAKKHPNQLSGGQMQRVALARAIVNNPKIILADEPTGALDSVTSIQVLELLKDASKDRLVIMVTHNEELANKYAQRIIRMKDGVITSDSAPLPLSEKPAIGKEINKKTSMSFWTALKSSFENIRTKKGRTILTAVASSIGIIGVALVLSVSNGFSNYVENVERSVASAVPISITPVTYNYSNAIVEDATEYPTDSNVGVYDTDTTLVSIHYNKYDQSYFDYLNHLNTDSDKKGWANSVLYNKFGQAFNLLTKSGSKDSILSVDQYASAGVTGSAISSVTSLPTYVFHELYGSSDDMATWYDVIEGKMPTNKNEIVLITDRYNRVEKNTLIKLGYLDSDDDNTKSFSFDQILGKEYKAYRNVDYYRTATEKELSVNSWKITGFDQDNFQFTGENSTSTMHYFQRNATDAEVFNNDATYNPINLKVVGILRPSKNSYINLMPSSIGYTSALKDYITSDGIEDGDPNQAANIKLDAALKEAAATNTYISRADNPASNADGLNILNTYMATQKKSLSSILEKIKNISSSSSFSLTSDEQTAIGTFVSGFASKLESTYSYFSFYANKNESYFWTYRYWFLRFCQSVGADLKQSTVVLPSVSSGTNSSDTSAFIASCVTFAKKIFVDCDSFFNTVSDYSRTDWCAIDLIALENQFSLVTSILIFPASLTTKAKLTDYLDAYNDSKETDAQVYYSDIMGTFTSSLGVLINMISTVLIVFASISLVVSCIMTGIITYVSVVERTKEIGILRACGARKRDVGRLFEAECVIIGTAAGLLGIITTIIIDIPLSQIIDHLYPGNNLSHIAQLNPLAGLILVAVAIVLAFISGLIPAQMAAKKDPVVALRSE